jgi:glutamyl endopeptidase
MDRVLAIVIVTASLSALGCDSEIEGTVSTSAPLRIDRLGGTFVFNREITEFSRYDSTGTVTSGATPIDTLAVVQPTARMLVGKREYISTGALPTLPEKSTPAVRPSVGGMPENKSGVEKTSGALVLGTDTRYAIGGSAWPFSPSFIVNYVGGGNCSGTLIGPHTGVSAAHCFWDAAHNTWFNIASFQAGNGQGPMFYSTSLVVPGAYHSPTDASDYALVDFSPSGSPPPGSFSGWLGTYPRSFLDELVGVPAARGGYDGDKQTPPPQEWGSEGRIYPYCYSVYGAPYDCSWIAHNLDTFKGASGSGLFLTTYGQAGYLSVVAIHTGFEDGIFHGTNIGTRWTGTQYNFFHAYDTHWP